MMDDAPIFHLKFKLLVEDDWPPVAVESLPCRAVEDGYQILDAPLYIKGLSNGDIIALDDAPSDVVTSWHHVRKSPHTTIWLLRMSTPNNLEDVLAELRSLGCSTTSLPKLGSYAVDVPGEITLETVDRSLSKLDEQAVAIAYSALRHQS